MDTVVSPVHDDARSWSSGDEYDDALSSDEGGRSRPFSTGFSPQFFFGTTDVTGTIDVGEAVAVSPGDRATISFELIKQTESRKFSTSRN